jgi:hypothetical protein
MALGDVEQRCIDGYIWDISLSGYVEHATGRKRGDIRKYVCDGGADRKRRNNEFSIINLHKQCFARSCAVGDRRGVMEKIDKACRLECD